MSEAFTSKRGSSQSSNNKELPESVAKKLEFLRTHKEDIHKNALNDFINKKCNSFSDNKRTSNGNESELTKVVSSRTASLVNNTSKLNSSLSLSTR